MCSERVEPGDREPSITVNTGAMTTRYLFRGIEKGDIDIVLSCLNNGVSANARDALGATPLTAVVFRGESDLARLLLDHGAMLDDPRSGRPLILSASRRGKFGIVRALLEHGATHKPFNGITPLYMARRCRHERVVRLLLQHGAPIGPGFDGASPLFLSS